LDGAPWRRAGGTPLRRTQGAGSLGGRDEERGRGGASAGEGAPPVQAMGRGGAVRGGAAA